MLTCRAIVILRNSRVDLERLDDNDYIPGCATPGSKTKIFPEQIPEFVSLNAFAVHNSCLKHLHYFSQSEWTPLQLFELALALQSRKDLLGCTFAPPEAIRKFSGNSHVGGQVLKNASAIFDPSISFSELRNPKPRAVSTPAEQLQSSLFRLPTEIMTAILSFLPPSDLLCFLVTSQWSLDHSHLLAGENSLQFHACFGPGKVSEVAERVIQLELDISKARRCKESGVGDASRVTATLLRQRIDERWPHLLLMKGTAALLPRFVTGSESENGSLPNPPQVEYRDLYIDVPEKPEWMEVFFIRLRGRSYICGLGFLSNAGEQIHVGFKSALRMQIAVTEDLCRLRFRLDSIGLMNLSFDDAPWQTRLSEAEELETWVGLSIRNGTRRLKIATDVSCRCFLVHCQSCHKR